MKNDEKEDSTIALLKNCYLLLKNWHDILHIIYCTLKFNKDFSKSVHAKTFKKIFVADGYRSCVARRN